MNLDKCKSNGSYVIVESSNINNETVTGIIAIDNQKYNFNKGDKVLYHSEDFKIIHIGERFYHAVNHYNIILCEKMEEEMKVTKKLEFTGMDVNF